MASNSSVNLADLLWNAARDGMWHTPDEVFQRMPFKEGAIQTALNFLVKYGFAQLDATKGPNAFRMKMSSPSPMETVRILRSLTRSQAAF